MSNDYLKSDNERTLSELCEQLECAKKAVLSTLNNEGCSVDMHGLSYWADRVENLRKKIKAKL